jgi:predicted O-methyltransferase YrrM
MLLAFFHIQLGVTMAVTVEEHSPFLEALIYLNQAKVVVEIGVAEAKTTAFLCRGAARVNGKVYGYDIWDTHGLQNQFKHWSSKEKCEEYLHKEGHVNFELTKVDSKTSEFRELIKTKHPRIDLAFIDGCHSYDGIKNDFEVIYPQLSETGIIVFHDTMSIDGCREFMIELRTKLWDGTFDLVTFPYGSMVYGDGNVVDRRTGVSMLVKRGFAVSTQPIDEQCNLDEHFNDIYVSEEDWYEAELKRATKSKK